MEKIKDFVKFIIKTYRFLKIDLILSFFLFHFSLFINLRKIFSKEFKLRKIVLISEAGFGHTIHDVEIIKFVLNDNFLIIILSEHKRHNWELANIWKDIDVIHLFKTSPFFSPDTQDLMQKYCTYVLYKLAKINKIKLIEFENNYNQKYLNPTHGIINRLIEKASTYKDYKYKSDIKTNFSFKNQYEGYFAYFFLKTKLDIQTIEFNRKLENIFIKKLKKINPDNKKIINIYLRQKGRDNRCGSSIQEWEKVMYYLIKNDYCIFLTGDIHLNRFSKGIRKKIFSFNNFKLSKNIFSISAPYFCDYCISENGGGSWFGMIMNKPTLMVNCWQFYGSSGGPGYYLLFKNLKSQKTKKIIPLVKSLKQYFWKKEIPKDTFLENNTSEQIIQGFEDLLKKNNLILFKDIKSETKYSWASATNSLLVSSNNIY